MTDNFLSNVWYMAGWSDDLPQGAMLARTIAERAILFWRDDGGVVAAISDRCPHRLVPLRHGKFSHGGVACGYHGLTFDRNGHCIVNPSGPVTSALHIASFPCEERHKAIWVWAGDRDQADVDLIPDLSFIERAPRHAISKGYMHMAAGHQLLVDNILDLSHADYLHPDTLGGGSISRSRPAVARLDHSRVSVTWTARDEPPLPIMRDDLENKRVDMETQVVWHPSGVMPLSISVTPVDGETPGIATVNAHVMTPETSQTTHYFHCNSRNFRTEDAAYNEHRAAAIRRAFEFEDKPMVEAQQRQIGPVNLLTLGPALLLIDKASVLVRRIYDELVEVELGGRV